MSRFAHCLVSLAVVLLLASPTAAPAQQSAVPCNTCDGASTDCNSCRTTCAGFIAGADMVVLRPYASDPERATLTDEEGVLSMTMADNKFDICPRLWFGYVGAKGLGARARYFRFDHGLDAEAIDVETTEDSSFFDAGTRVIGNGRLAIYAVDVDMFQQVHLGMWNAVLGGGIRAGGVGRTFDYVVDEPEEAIRAGELSKEFDGVGPTIFAEFRRPIGSRGLALIANTRGSVLFGSERLRIAGAEFDAMASSASEKNDAIVGVAEIQLGGEWSRPLARGGRVFVNALWEAQLWSGSGPIIDVISNDIGLVGCSIGAGIVR
ncbi:MAG: Lpg1974 family pore-forming outer membrane protein [Planctomycetia bacterium]|nr:Lpg1974 family pore-forming outer membrane protein [Planctomycetia bacterium]